MNRYGKTIVVLIIAVAFILPTAMVIIGGTADDTGAPAPTQAQAQSASPEDMDFTKLSRSDRKRILDSVPNKDALTDAQKKEFLDTGRITMTAQPSAETPNTAPQSGNGGTASATSGS